MDPVLKMWFYEQWLGDHRDDAELAKNTALLLGSFWNPEAVKEMTNDNRHQSTDEDFEESLKMVSSPDMSKLSIKESLAPKRRRRKATLKE